MIVFIGSISAMNLYNLSKAIDGLMTDNFKSINAIANMLEAVERQDSAVLIYINVDRQQGIELYSRNSSEFMKWYNVELENITETGEKEIVLRLNNEYVNYLKLFSELQEIKNTSENEKVIEFYNSSMMPHVLKIKEELKSVTSLNENAMFSNKVRATENAQRSVYVVLAFSAAAAVGGYLLSRFFVNIFLEPLNTLMEYIKLVKAGDLNHQMSITSKDETGQLASEFNNMTKRLQQYEHSTLGKLMTEKNKSVTIVKSISEPLIVTDTNFRILVLNNACENFFNVKEESSINKHFLEVIRNGEIFEHISGILQSDEEHKEKVILIDMEDEYYFNINVTKIHDMETQVNGLIIVFNDVTNFKQLEKIKTDFIATISHEFKTPLTSITMGASLLQDTGIGHLNKKQMDIINTIAEDSERLIKLVSNLLELSKIESEKAIYKIRPCSIAGVIESSIQPLHEVAQQKGVNLHYENGHDLPKVNIDPEKISWVIGNLIMNAIKYTSPGDEIAVNVYHHDNKMYISVRDTGIGIPEEYLKKIFDKFVQVEGQDMEVRGTGLGLSIVKEIIKFHGGEIWCESKIDNGSNFIFTLPLESEE